MAQAWLKNEESIILLITMLALILILGAFLIAGVLEWYFALGLMAYVVILIGISKFLESKSKYKADKRKDERTAGCTQRAARNGYVFTLLAMGFAAMAYGTGLNPYGPINTLSVMFGAVVAVYFLSYLYYIGRDLI